MQFQVPQFIDIEDKIFGPLTLRQFLYLVGAGGFSFVLFFMLETWLWVIATLMLLVIAASFAFVKFNGQAFTTIITAIFKYLWLPKFYLWQRIEVKEKAPTLTLPKEESTEKNPLKNLLFKLTTQKGAVDDREKQLPKQERGPA